MLCNRVIGFIFFILHVSAYKAGICLVVAATIMKYIQISTLFENYSKCRIWIFDILAFSTNFCPIKTDLSGNTVWPQASDFQKLAKMDHFWHFLLTFIHSKCKCSSLRSQCWMRLFLWFSNTVYQTLHFFLKYKGNIAVKLSITHLSNPPIFL